MHPNLLQSCQLYIFCNIYFNGNTSGPFPNKSVVEVSETEYHGTRFPVAVLTSPTANGIESRSTTHLIMAVLIHLLSLLSFTSAAKIYLCGD